MSLETPARIAVLGAGPIGLEAALYARYLGYEVDLYERGRVAEHVLRWGHARMFSPFGVNRSPLGVGAIKAQDPTWQAPDDGALLTLREFAESYLVPLAHSDLLADSLHEQTEVVSIGRDGLARDELSGEDRAEHDFRLLLRSTRDDEHGREHFAAVDAVIDATGTWDSPNWLGHGGMPALGEWAARARIEHGLPDLLGNDRGHYAHRNILLVGDDQLAAANLVALAELAGQAADTWITWVTRTVCDEHAPHPIRARDDEFPARARLAEAANRLAADDANHVTFYSGTTIEAVAWHNDLDRFSVRLLGKHAGEIECDRIIANVGFRADHTLAAELQLRGTVPSVASDPPALSGRCTLIQPEPDYYILGAKSRDSDASFLIRDGLEQIRELFAIIGDRAELDLYATMPR